MPNNLKYDLKTNTGKILLQKIIQKLDLDNLITDRKQGFSVNTVIYGIIMEKKFFFIILIIQD